MSQFNVSYVFRTVNKMTAPARRIAKSLQGVTQSTQATTQASGKATQGTKQFTAALKSKNSALRSNAANTNAVTDATERLRAAEERMQAKLATAASATFVGGEMRKVGRTLLSPLLGAVNVTEGFEEKMSQVGAVANSTEEELGRLTSTARSLGASTSFAASQAADGMTYLSMAGFEVNETITAMPGLLNMAKAGAEDLGTAADIGSNILSGFKLEASQMSRVADVLTSTFTSSNTTLSSLGETMSYAAPAAAALNVSLEETAAFAGLLGNVGIQGSRAGTAINAALGRLSAPRDNAIAWFERFNIQTQDAEGNLRKPIELFAELARATESVGSATRAAAMKDIFGLEAAPALTELISQAGAGEIVSYVKELQQSSGAASRVAEKMGDNARGARKELASVFEGLQISMGSALLPVVKSVYQGLTSVIRIVNGILDRFPMLSRVVLVGVLALGAIATATGVAISAFAALYGSLAMLQFGMTKVSIHATLMTARLKAVSVASALGRGGMLRFASVLPAVVSGIRAVGLAVMANPIGLIATALIGAGVLIWAFWDKIKGFFAWIWRAASPIRSFFQGFWDGFLEGFRPTLESFSAMGEAVSGVAGPLYGLLKAVLMPMGAALSKIGSLFVQAFGWAWNQLAKIIPGMKTLNRTSLTLGQVFGAVFGAMANLLMAPINMVGALAKGFNIVLAKAKELISPVKTVAGWGKTIAGWFGGGDDENSVGNRARKAGQAATAAAAMVAPAASGSPALPAPAEPTPMVAPARGGDVVDNSTFAPQIHIDGSGLSEAQLQRVIRTEMARAERERQAQRRNRLHDE